jgi:predicted nucleic acid-binding protein
MAKIEIVSNAGPLINFSLLKKIDLLKRLFDKVYIPDAVFDEIIVGKNKPGEKELKQALKEGWLFKRTIENELAVQSLLGTLHRGEAEAIILSKELQIDRVIFDDLIARRKAAALGLKVTGTIGLMLLARQEGMSINMKENLDKLIDNGFRLSKSLYQRIINGK